MDAIDHVLGLAALAAVALSALAAAGAARRRWFADATGVEAVAVDAVLATGVLLATGLTLGTVGILTRPALVVAAIVVGPAALRWLDPHPTWGALRDGRPLRRRDLAVVAAVAVVAVRWISRLLEVLPGGTAHADALHYHLPMMADWVRSGETWSISFWSAGDASAYHPGNAELLHAIATITYGSDFPTLFVNLGFAAAALVAGWLLGRTRSNPLAGLLLVGAALSLRIVAAEAGQALTGTPALALLLLGVALLDAGRASERPSRYAWIAGLAVGMAIGVKLTVLVAGVALCLVVFRSSTRRTDVLRYVGGALAGGGYWFARNIAHTGSPIPATEIGPIAGPVARLLAPLEGSIVEYAGDADVWRDYFLPGLRSSFGPLWPLLTAAVLALVAATVLDRRAWRDRLDAGALALVAAASYASYLVNPQSAPGPPGDPWLFNANQRYVVPTLALGAVAALGHPAVRGRPRLATGAAAAGFVAANLWRPNDQSGMAVAAVAVAVAVVWGLPRLAPRARLGAGVALVVAAVVLSGVAQRSYSEERWTADGPPLFQLYEAADELRGVRIAVAGHPQTYPFYGADLDNAVRFIGDEYDDSLHPIGDCRRWWDAVERFDADLVAVLSDARVLASEFGELIVTRPRTWLAASGATVVAADEDGELYSLAGAEPRCPP